MAGWRRRVLQATGTVDVDKDRISVSLERKDT